MSEVLEIQITGHESFNWNGKSCSLIKGELPSENVAFECTWETKGLTNIRHTQKITIPFDKWEEAKLLYDEWLKEQSNALPST